MTNIQSNKLTMYETVVETLNANSKIWKDADVVKEAVNELAALLPQIRQGGAAKETTTKGITAAKREKKTAMANRGYKITALAAAYAARTKNTALLAALDYSLSDLLQVKDNIAIDRCTAIHGQIRPLLSELEAYGVTKADLDSLQADIKAFQAYISSRGQQQSSRSATLHSVAALHRQADGLLRTQLDKLMLRYRDSNRSFYDAYQSARITRHLGGSHKAEKPA